MKKTVVIIILAIYLASVAVVNFFGLEIKQYDGETYVGSIEINEVLFLGNNNEPITPQRIDGETLYYEFEYIPPADGGNYSAEDASNRNMVRIDFVLYSESGEQMPYDDGRVEYIYPKPANPEDTGIAFFHEGTGSFVFCKPNQTFTITIKATDGHNAKTQIIVMAKSPSGTKG